MKYSGLLTLFLLFYYASHSQEIRNPDIGQIHGNFDATTQYYNVDTAIDAPIVPEKMLLNSFTNVIYTKGDFSAGARFESYLNVLKGFDPRYQGTGFPYRYASYNADKLGVTLGSFYEQFGSGMIFRSYEERGLGVDNAMDGIRLKYNLYKGVYLKGVWGKQRLFMDKGPGIVRGIDGEVNINEFFTKLDTIKTRITVGGSFVSKYQLDQNSTFVLPENVSAYGGRVNLVHGKINLMGEYVYKMNDPSADNYFIYKTGQSAFVSGSFSQKGLGITLSAKSIDNMGFRSDRNESLNTLMINYLPALTKQHTYNLAATLYPYATQPRGEVGVQADVLYKIKNGSKLGGKYGTTIAINYSRANSLDTTQYYDYRLNNEVNPNDSMRIGYKTNFFGVGDEVYFEDFNVEISRKFNKAFKLKAMYLYILYNSNIINPGNANKFNQNFHGTVYSHIGVLDGLYKLNSKNAIRVEVQHLYTKQDYGSWITGVLEYTFSPHWFFAVMDQYNYGNAEEKYKFHYPIVSSGYNTGGTRFTLTYGRQRAGIFCVGGVCRNVPASNGLTLSITSTF